MPDSVKDRAIMRELAESRRAVRQMRIARVLELHDQGLPVDTIVKRLQAGHTWVQQQLISHGRAPIRSAECDRTGIPA